MKLKESITVEEILGKKFKVRTIQPLEYGEAALTHYLHNAKTPESIFYKEEALSEVKRFLESKGNENVDLEVAENALQGLLFDFQNEVPFKPPTNPQFKFIDLFAGIGGFRLALQNLGGKCVFTSEWDEKAKKTYRTNYGEIPFGDITSEETKGYIPDNFDILCAGFPCQAFSIAGYRKGFSDTRGTLFFHIEDIAEKHRPRVIFLENVKNLVGHDKGRTFDTILEILEKKLGYYVYYKVLNSMTHANVPQNRERIFIVAFDKGIKNHRNFSFPESIPLTRTIFDCIENEVEEKYYYQENHPYFPTLQENMINRNTIYQWRRVYVRENKSNVCPTLTANMGAGGHNVPLISERNGIRKLTPRECFAFQGYPVNDYVLPKIADSHLYKQAGNSVTVPLIERIGERILDIL